MHPSNAHLLRTPAHSDADAAASIQPVQDSISSAQSAIGTIAKSLLTGQQAPDDARDQVKDGLVAAGTALGNITS